MKKLIVFFNLLFLWGLITYAQSGWIPQSSNTNYDLSSVFFVGNTGYAVGGNGQTNANVVLRTIDSGLNWTIRCYTKNQFYSIFFTDTNTGFAVDFNGILQTTDGGETWLRIFDNQHLSKYSSLESIFFADSNTGYCVGGFQEFGPILKTNDGGKTWTDKTSEFNTALNSVYFIDKSIGYVVGNAGTILKTEDGGTSWAKQTSGTSACLTSVVFLNKEIGYVVGFGGTILKTTDGGVTWITQTSGTTNELRSVFFTDVDTGYIVGGLITEYGCCDIESYGGTILKTTDGGTSWIPQSGAETSLLYSVCFINNNTGFAVGTNGSILTTTTGGTSVASNLTFDKNINVYPNPNDGDFTIKFNNPNKKLLQIEIKDITGKPAFKTTCSQNAIQLSKKELPKGIYLISISGNGISYTTKTILK